MDTRKPICSSRRMILILYLVQTYSCTALGVRTPQVQRGGAAINRYFDIATPTNVTEEMVAATGSHCAGFKGLVTDLAAVLIYIECAFFQT